MYNMFPNIGFYKFQFDKNSLSFLNKEITDLENSFPKDLEFNPYLSGNIDKEFKITKSINNLQHLLLPHIAKYNEESNILSQFNIMNKSLPLYLDTAWVNFQKKLEFNPNHNHEGIVSFVIWTQIPYDTEIENNIAPGKYSNSNCPGQFEFQYTTTLGQINHYRIPCNKNLENTVLIFPSKLMHCVYPFYSSDDYRISVSGNFKLMAE